VTGTPVFIKTRLKLIIGDRNSCFYKDKTETDYK
jgi:hypothetical protein